MANNSTTMKKVLVKCKSKSPPSSTSSSRCILSSSQRSFNDVPRFQQDTAWSWVVCFCATISNIIVVGISYSYGVLLPALLDYFKEDITTTAWVGSLCMSISFILGPISASLCDQYGCRLTAFAGAVMCCLGLLMTSQAPSIYTMFLTYSIITGFGACCVYTTTFITVPKYFTRNRSQAVGIICIGPSAGVMVMAPVIQMFLDVAGWRTSLLALAAMCFVICLLVCTFDSDTVVRHPNVSASSLNSGGLSKKCPYGTIFRNKMYMMLLVSSCLHFFGLYNPQTYLVKYCQTRGISSDKASMLFFYIGLLSSISRVACGRVLSYPYISNLVVAQVSMTFIGLLFMVLPWATTYSHMMVYAILLGCADGFTGTTLNLSIMGAVEERYRGHSYGVWLTACAIPIALGSPLTGFVVDKTGYAAAFRMSGTMVIAAGLVCFLAYFVHKRDTRAEITLHDLEVLDDRKVLTEKITVV